MSKRVQVHGRTARLKAGSEAALCGMETRPCLHEHQFQLIMQLANTDYCSAERESKACGHELNPDCHGAL